jgi:hypothetical protein
MKVPLFLPALLLLFMPGPAGPGAAEFTDGPVKLILHEDTGRFSLYHMNDMTTERFEPLFAAQDPRTSFVSVILNDKSYRLGESPAFRLRLEGEGPSLVFQSSFLRVREEFSFIKTAGSSLTNGIRITITLENTGPREVNLGLRFLLDTSLGEGKGGAPPFLTDLRPLEAETLISAGDEDGRWITRNSALSLMGSIGAGVEQGPDLVHFANWKRLNEAPWKTGYSAGRNFNYLPYSIGDSAVCYYYEPRLLARGDTFARTILLAVEDPRGFTPHDADSAGGPPLPPQETVPLPQADSAPAPAPADDRDADIALLRDLISRVDRFVAGEISITEEDLTVMEATITRLKARYGLP